MKKTFSLKSSSINFYIVIQKNIFMLQNLGLLLKEIFSTQPDVAFIKVLLFFIISLILVAGIENLKGLKVKKKFWKIAVILIALMAVLGLPDKTVTTIMTSYSYATIFIFLGLPIIGILYFSFTYKNNTTIGSFIKTITFGIASILLDHTYKLLEYYNPALINTGEIIALSDVIDIILLVTLILFFYYLYDLITKIFFKEDNKNE